MVELTLSKLNHFGLVLLYKKSGQMSTRNIRNIVTFHQTKRT